MKKSLNKHEVEALNSEIATRYGAAELLARKDRTELFEKDGLVLVLRNGTPAIFYKDRVPVPHLKLLLQQNILKTVSVDRGAIKFVTNGADIMRPGITAIADGIRKDDLVAVVDQEHGKPLAVGIAQGSTEELRAMASGKAVKNIHWVGDKLWTLEV